MKTRWLFLIVLLSAYEANAEDTIVLGRALSHKYLEVEMGCPEDYICMDSWFKWELSIDQVIAGPSLAGRISAARLQHTNYIRKYERSLRLFVLRPISDSNLRELVGADYQLIEVSAPNEMYCITSNPADYGIDTHVYVRSEKRYQEYCFALDDSEE